MIIATSENNLAIKFPELLKDWDYKNNGNPYDYSPYSNKKVAWKCSVCDYSWIFPISDRTYRHCKCPACIGKTPTLKNNFAVKFPELLNEWNRELNGDPYKYLPHSHKKVNWKCSECGRSWNSRIQDRTDGGNNCPFCSSSRAEKAMRKFFIKNSIEFISQYSFNNCRNKKVLRFDFAILNSSTLLLLLETQGVQHYKPTDFAGKGKEWAEKNFLYIQENDNIKLQYCEDNNISLIRIPYWEFDNIESILESELFPLLREEVKRKIGKY